MGDTTLYYRTRPIWSANQISMFTMTNKPGNSKNSLLSSYSMFMKYSSSTMDATPCERVVFRMKEGTTN